jgi:GNAT superfamily N-acetyltransferase
MTDLRAATPADAERIARTVIDGFEHYRSFAPPGWEPPPLDHEIEVLRDLLPDERVWCRLAESGGAIVGQVTFLPASRAAVQDDDPELAHLRNLFVDERHWGTGLATTLHSAAIGEARRRGFTTMRLFTPAGQARARRFYEREGWRPAGEEFYAPGPDLALVEYRCAL